MKSLSKFEVNLILDNYRVNYFISSASFEERCYQVSLLFEDSEFDKSLIFGTVDFDAKITDNREHIVKLLKKSKETITYDLYVDNPVVSFITMIDACALLFTNEPKTLVIDITTFTHEYLLMIFRILKERKREEDTMLIMYVGAKKYSHNTDNEGEKWLTKGVKGLRSIIGYPGYSDPSKKNHLIILVGFEVERTIKLIEDFDFDLVSLAFGAENDSIGNDNQKINADKYAEIFSLFPNSLEFQISLTDPKIVKTTILEHISKYHDYNIVVAPMNNKISTIGAGLAAIENKEIQLFYQQANIYNTDAYSQASDDYFLIEI